jgi:hypothetical protein
MQKGSAHVIIIALLIVALSGTLGIVFYQNFIAKTPLTETVNDLPTEANQAVKAQIAFKGTIYEMEQPNAWKVIEETAAQEPTPTSILKIANPDQTIHVTLTVSDMLEDRPCDANDGLKVRYYNVHKNPVKNLVDEPLYVVEAMTDHAGGGYNYSIGLTQDGGDTHAALADSHCTIKNIGIASFPVLDTTTKKMSVPAVTATITFPKLLDPKEQKIKSMDPAKELIATDYYKAAVKILESARKK